MKSRTLITTIPFLVLSLLAITITGPSAHAQGLDQCASAPTAPCLSIWFDTAHSPNLLDTTKGVGSQFVAEVNITNAGGINAFDITIFYDPTYLAAQRLSFTATSGDGVASVFQGHNNFVLANDTTSFSNSAELALSSVDTVNGHGMLFSVVFNVVALTNAGPTAIFFQPGLATVNNGADLIPANLRDGSFRNVAPALFDYSLSVSPTGAAIDEGQSTTATVTASLVSGTSNSISLTTAVTGASCGTSCPTATLNPTTGTPTFTSGLSIATSTTTPSGDYTITINGTPDDNTADGGETTTFLLTVRAPTVHDVAVTAVTASPLNVVRPPESNVTVTITVSNNGGASETFTVSAQLVSGTSTMTVGTNTVSNLAPAASSTVTMAFNVTGTADGSYVVRAVASTVTGETNTNNNSMDDGTLVISTQTQQQLVVTAKLTVNGPFASTPSAIFATETVAFDASASTATRGNNAVPIISYAWDFNGDGVTDETTTTPIIMRKPYPSGGTFTPSVTVTATDNIGSGTGTASQTITVQSEPVLAHGKLSWTHHLKVSAGQDQVFTATFTNPSSTNLYIYVQIDIVSITGSQQIRAFVSNNGPAILVNSGQLVKASTTVSASQFTAGASYDVTATIWYNVDNAPIGPGDGANGYLIGANSKSGSFAAV
ncbi:MAG: hypothetical protein AUI97_01860 [Crenarchaeota archaeon 13_1_40CM_3_52_17]|nr:MAG: hypothetical protein AUI97_01860 [Crenarchaeota archaeon 13_1_40CM_3_52_17]